MHLAHGEKGGSHLLRRDLFSVLAAEAESAFVVGDAGVERADCDPEVVDA
jgi:hypothetical protein